MFCQFGRTWDPISTIAAIAERLHSDRYNMSLSVIYSANYTFMKYCTCSQTPPRNTTRHLCPQSRLINWIQLWKPLVHKSSTELQCHHVTWVATSSGVQGSASHHVPATLWTNLWAAHCCLHWWIMVLQLACGEKVFRLHLGERCWEHAHGGNWRWWWWIAYLLWAMLLG